MDKSSLNNTPDYSDPPQDRVLKLIGGDTELGNFVYGAAISSNGTGYEASRAVLHEVDGLPRMWSSRAAPTPIIDTYNHRTYANDATMPIRLAQADILRYDPVHDRLPSNSVGVAASLP